jgi:hypothetical protein
MSSHIVKMYDVRIGWGLFQLIRRSVGEKGEVKYMVSHLVAQPIV